MPRIRLNQLNIQPQEYEASEEELHISETGPWSVSVGKSEAGTMKVCLQSDDFTHDVALYITGDFYDNAQRIEYAHRLADRMNRMPKE
jgi:hypothetical protein